MWVLMEIIAMATDLAEFLGAALGFYLLLGIPLWIAGIITAIITFVILWLERYGFRPLEAVIADIIILGNHSKTAIDAFWSGSVTLKIATQTHLPLLLVPVHDIE
ncbi:MAG: divalent metal cation transporter [Anaerolineales bacterium]